jgi:hypothetical protein
MREMSNGYKPVGRPRSKWNDYIEIDFVKFDDVGWSHLIQDMFLVADLVNTVMKVKVSKR